MPYPRIEDFLRRFGLRWLDGAAASARRLGRAHLVKGPFHADLPDFEPIGDELTLPVLLKLGDDVSTDGIVPAGVASLSLYSSVPGMTSIRLQTYISTNLTLIAHA